MRSRYSFRFFLLSLLGLILWVSLGGAGGCSGGNVEEQDQPSQLTGPVRLVSIYPSGGPPGATVSVCAQGVAAEAIFSFCDQPQTVSEDPSLKLNLENDPSYVDCDEGTTEVLLTVPDNCPIGEVKVKAVAGTEASNEISFVVTLPPPAQNQDQGGDTQVRQGDTGGTTTGGTTTGGTTTGGTTTGGTTTGSRRITPDPIINTDINCPDERTCEGETPICETTTGDCVGCLLDQDCHGGPEYDGPGFQCDLTTKTCVEIECTETNLSRCTDGTITVDCTHGCTCNTGNRCVGNDPPPDRPEFYVEADESSGNIHVPGDLATTLPEDKLKFGAIHLKSDRAERKYIYGNFSVRLLTDETHYNRATSEQRVVLGWVGGVLVRFRGHEQTRFYVVPRIFNDAAADGYIDPTPLHPYNFWPRPSPYAAFTPSADDFVECWPDARVGDPNYCAGLEDNFSEAMEIEPDPNGVDRYGLRQRVFKLKLHEDNAKVLFEMVSRNPEFVAVVRAAGGSDQILEPGHNFHVPEPQINKCRIEPMQQAPYYRVNMQFSGATNAFVHANIGNDPVSGSVKLHYVDDKGEKLTADAESEYRFVPVQKQVTKIHCVVEGIDKKVAQRYDLRLGAITQENLKLEPAAREPIEPASEVPPVEQGLDEAGCTDNNNRIRWDLGGGSEELLNEDDPFEDDDRLGRCDVALNWEFSQLLTVDPEPAELRFLLNSAAGGEGPASEEFSFPWVGKVQLEAYRDPTTGESPDSCADDQGAQGPGSSVNSKLLFPVIDIGAVTRNQPILSVDPAPIPIIETPEVGACAAPVDPSADPSASPEPRDNVMSCDVSRYPPDHENYLPEFKLSGFHDRLRKYDTCNRYRLKVWQFGGYSFPSKTVDLRYRSDFAVGDAGAIETLTNAASVGPEYPSMPDDAVELESIAILQQDRRHYIIPIKAQHIKGPIEIEVLYYGCPGGCQFTTTAEPPVGIMGGFFENECEPGSSSWFCLNLSLFAIDEHPWSRVPARQGWMRARGGTPINSEPGLYVYTRRRLFGPEQGGVLNWAPRAGVPNPALQNFNATKYIAQGSVGTSLNTETEDVPDDVVDPGQLPDGLYASGIPATHFDFEGRLRIMRFKITATGHDGEPHTRITNTRMPSSSSRFVRPSELFYDRGVDQDGHLIWTQFFGTESEPMPSCESTNDCPHNCNRYVGELPCLECRPEGVCAAREWQSNTIEWYRATHPPPPPTGDWRGSCINSGGTDADGEWRCSQNGRSCHARSGSYDDKVCDEDYYCKEFSQGFQRNGWYWDARCVRKKANGESCDGMWLGGFECQTGRCVNGICGDGRSSGSYCQYPFECASGYCDRPLNSPNGGCR